MHDARIYNANDGMSLDTFFVLDSRRPAHRRGWPALKHIRQLTDALASTASEPHIVQRRTPRQMKSFSIPTETSMSVDEDQERLRAGSCHPDRPGLLARLGKIFVDFNVELQAAKIQTLGERVEDVFFITDDNQQAITDPHLCRHTAAIRDELDEQAAA